MPFGMINSAATLKRAMKKLIKDLDNVDFYWDDILVHTRTWEEHIKALQELFARLMQKHDEKLFPVCYASKKLSSAERNYSTIEKECLAVVWGIKRFHLYLYGVPFVLQTDHEPLKYMNSAKFANGRLMRWAMFLQSYTFRVEAIKGSENVGADYLSRADE